jgi:hypothetical protein
MGSITEERERSGEVSANCFDDKEDKGEDDGLADQRSIIPVGFSIALLLGTGMFIHQYHSIWNMSLEEKNISLVYFLILQKILKLFFKGSFPTLYVRDLAGLLGWTDCR